MAQTGDTSTKNFGNDAAPTDYADAYLDIADEAAGGGFADAAGGEENAGGFRGKKNTGAFGARDEEEKVPASMFFDFRRGSTRWPEKVELLSPETAEAVIQKKMDAVAKEQPKAGEGGKTANTSSVSGGPKAGERKKMEGFGNSGGNYDVQYPTGWGVGGEGGSSDEDSEEEAEVVVGEDGVERRAKPGAPAADPEHSPAPAGAKFETLNDGSTAFVVPTGWRLKLDLNDLLKGGDEKKAERKQEEARKEKEAAARKKKRSQHHDSSWDVWGEGASYGGGGGGGGGGGKKYEKWCKDTIGEWTVTMDVKLSEAPPREGLSLLHTALIHSEDTKGRTKLKPTEGEAVVNCDGGVGQLGTFGDTAKAGLVLGRWHRVVVSAKVAASDKKKGELRTWVDTVPGCVLKSEAVVAGRFEVDLDGLFLFSSSDPAMMPGGLSLRTVRVEQTFATDKTVKEGRAKDRLLSMLNEEARRKVDFQRRGLSLADLFAKPRPVWATPALVGTFGDAYIEGTGFEGTSTLAWSFTVLNHALQTMLRSPLADTYLVGLDSAQRGKVSDVLHVFSKSAATFKAMARLLKNPNAAQLTGFLRRIKKLANKITVGETLLLPVIIENTELLLLMVRKSDKFFDLVVCATDPELSLKQHAVNASQGTPAIHFRTCLVVANVEKKLALDDVFFAALYNLTTRCTAKDTVGDMQRFYDVLIPFVTGKPLEQTLIEAEADQGTRGAWRLPQRSSTSYVRCVFEALNFMLTTEGSQEQGHVSLSQPRADQVHLALQAQLVRFVANDLQFVVPDENGRRVCEMALSSFSDATVRLAQAIETEAIETETETEAGGGGGKRLAAANDGKKEGEKKPHSNAGFGAVVPEATRAIVLQLGADLAACADDVESLPAHLDLSGKGDAAASACGSDPPPPSSSSAAAGPALSAFPLKLDPTEMQYRDHLCFEAALNEPDPGQAATLRKYDPVDLLKLPEVARTRAEAVDALRLCDKQCVRLANQSHCLKNPKHLIASLIEHVFTQVIAVPKPRAVPKLDAKRIQRAAVAEKRRADREAKDSQEKARRATEWAEFKGKKKASSSAAAAGASKVEGGEEKEEDEETNGDGMADEEEQLLERSPGEAAEAAATAEPCYWDADITYDLQVELLLCLSRLAETFVSAAMSLQHSRAFDAVCTVVPGVICAVSDAVLRRLAIDRPSEVSGILLGMTAEGKQLGFPGFGTSVATFAEQTETLEIHSPELSVARTAVLDYFQSPNQQRLEKVFDWEVEFAMKPTRSLVKFLRHVCRAMAFADAKPHQLLLDSSPESSLLMKHYPELRPWRDVVCWWKWFLNADVTTFPNYSDPEAPRDIADVDRLGAQLKWQWNNEEKGYQVSTLSGSHVVRCRPDPKKTDPVTGRAIPLDMLPRNRYPSTATPSFYLPAKPTVRTEDDVIYRPNLPSFDVGQGAVLTQRDSELLITYLTVPYLRLPLVLAFFASDDRVHKLQSPKLKGILDSVVFEPGRYLRLGMTGVVPAMVPTQHPSLLSSAYGLLLNELHTAPNNVVTPLLALLDGALALDTGAVCDVGGTDFNTGVDIILYVARLAARVDNALSFLVDHQSGTHRCVTAETTKLREVHLSGECLATLRKGVADVRGKLHGDVASLIEEYLLKLDKETAASPGNEKLIDRNSRLACDLHAHRLVLYRNKVELTTEVAKTILGSFVFLTTRHTWNKAARAQGKLLLPETELYELLTVVRRRLVTWPQLRRQGTLDLVLQTALQVSSASSSGSLKAKVDSSNRWSVIWGPAGRFAVASTRTVNNNDDEGRRGGAGAATGAAVATMDEFDDDDDLPPMPPKKALPLLRQSSSDALVEEVADTGLLGVEMDLQVGQMTLRSKHLQALEAEVANHPDVRHLFGDSTMQSSLLERAEFRSRFRLVGLGHELEYWPAGHDTLPPLSDQWERDYDPAGLGDDEAWVGKLFEPVRKNFFDGPQPPPMQFMMLEKQLPKDAEVATLIGLHQGLGGPFKLVLLFRRYRCVQVFECVSQGRQWWYTLHLSSDARFSLRELQPDTGPRGQPFPKWWGQGAGSAYPRGVNAALVNDAVGVSSSPFSSVVIKRDASDTRNLSGGVETFVPARLLLGFVPQALLDAYDLFQDEAKEPPSLEPGAGRQGYMKLRGYPKSDKVDTMLVVEFQPIGSWEGVLSQSTVGAEAEASASGGHSGAAAARRTAARKVEATGLPGRSVRVLRRSKAVMELEFVKAKAVAAELERGLTMNLLDLNPAASASSKVSKLPKKGDTAAASAAAASAAVAKKNTNGGGLARAAHVVGETVEFDTDGLSGKWVTCEVLKVHCDNEHFDLEPSEGWVGRQTNVPVAFLRKLNAGNKSGEEGVGVWKFDGLSDSEDEEWRGGNDSANANTADGVDDDEEGGKPKKNKLAFEVFDRLGLVLSACGGDETIAIAILRKLSAQGQDRGSARTSSFSSVSQLARAVEADARQHFSAQVKALEEAKAASSGCLGQDSDMELLNLLGAPRRSRLHSLVKTLTRVENLGFILAWTTETKVGGKDANAQEGEEPPCASEFEALLGCPTLGLVELPRLKIAFRGRKDYSGVLRLYSLDHSDLFITNHRRQGVNKMLQGIPHSLLLANGQGEFQVLVPVLSPPRPAVRSQPFSTTLVLDRSDDKWAAALDAKYYMYPVHVSGSFLLTKGLNAALYLLLLRLLHRDYDDVYRLTDSVATDTALNGEGEVIFKALAFASDDHHPDAHACRLKVSLVVADAGVKLPWDLTKECAKYVLKLGSVAATCRLSLEEELQVLETDQIVLDDQHKDFHPQTHDPYTLTLVVNRLSCLRAHFAGESSFHVCHPLREGGSAWPFHVDSTALGEVYNKTTEVESVEDMTALLEGRSLPGPDTTFAKWFAVRNFMKVTGKTLPTPAGDGELGEGRGCTESGEKKEPMDLVAQAPSTTTTTNNCLEFDDVLAHPFLQEVEASPQGVAGWLTQGGATGGAPAGGFLSVVVFQVLWSAECAKVLPQIEELAPIFPQATFALVRADRVGVDTISRSMAVHDFPTIVVLRGTVEVARIEGAERCVGRLADALRLAVGAEDSLVCEALRRQEVEEGGGEAGEEEEEELVWSWDPEYASESIKVLNYGTLVAMVKQDGEEEGEPGKWQFQNENQGDEDGSAWEEFEEVFSAQLERQYRNGSFYLEGAMTAMGPQDGVAVRFNERRHKITQDCVEGMTATFSSNPYETLSARRKGARLQVSGDDKYCSETQKAADKFELEWKVKMASRKAELVERNKGKDLEGVRGTNSFVEESGTYKWSCKFGHEPGRQGRGDAVGICSELAEYFGPLEFPVLGHRGGHSLGLYADGSLVFDHRVVATMEGPPRSKHTVEGEKEASLALSAAVEGEDKDSGSGGGKEEKLPACYQRHPWQLKAGGHYCERCYTRPTEFTCDFCSEGYCQKCYDKEHKKLNASEDDAEKKKNKKKKKKSAKKRRDEDDEDDEDEESEGSNSDEDENDDEDDDDEEEEDDDDEKEEEDEEERAEATFRAIAKEKGLSEEQITEMITSSISITSGGEGGEGVSAAAAGGEEGEGAATGKAGTKGAVDFKALLKTIKGAKKRDELESFIPPEPETQLAVLFGRGSTVTIILDTDKNGGTLCFEVDGQVLKSAENGTVELTKVFEMLGTSQLYPALNLSPLDSQPVLEESKAPEVGGGKKEKGGKEGSAGGKTSSSKAKKGSVGGDDDEAVKKRLEQKEIEELAVKCRKSFHDVAKLSLPMRAQLTSRVDSVLKTRVPNIQLILGDDQDKAVNHAKAEAEAKAEEERKEQEAVAAAAAAEDDTDGETPAGKTEAGAKELQALGSAAATAAGAEVAAAFEPEGEEAMDRIAWMYESENGWQPHSKEVSATIEEALRSGRSELTVNVNQELFTVKVVKGSDGKGPGQTSEEGSTQRLRRHVTGEGLQGEWEMLSLKFAPPMSMNGQGALAVLEKCWEAAEDFRGQTHGLGFLFLYNLMQGATRVRCIGASAGSGYGGGGYGRDYGKNDAHRFAILLTQLFSDRGKRSLLGSVANILARNRHVCVRMPKLKDTRKSRQSPVFNGWCDEAEPKSPIADLFSKLVPALQRLKRQRGALRFPPKPPFPEIPALPTECDTPKEDGGGSRAVLSDTSRSELAVGAVSAASVASLCATVRFNLLGNFNGSGATNGGCPPMEVEDIEAFDLVADACAEGDQIFVAKFSADWCGACGQVSPVYRQLGMRLGAVATFAKVDVDENEAAARRFRVKALPTVLFLRGGGGAQHVVGRLEGSGEIGFAAEFMKVLQSVATAADLSQLHASARPQAPSEAAAQGVAIGSAALKELATQPLASLFRFVCVSTRTERGLPPISSDSEALDAVGKHEAAGTAVASAMLVRMKEDCAAFASIANTSSVARIKGVGDADLQAYFFGKKQGQGEGVDGDLVAARGRVGECLEELTRLRDDDIAAIGAALPLLRHAANFVDTDNHAVGSTGRQERVLFQLKRSARQAPSVWSEFLFGSTLSTKGDEDLKGLNPYCEDATLGLVQRLLTVSMLRANRVAHANRCVGTSIALLGLLDKALLLLNHDHDDEALAEKGGSAGLCASSSASQRKEAAAVTLIPKLAQASADLGEALASRRHFVALAVKEERQGQRKSSSGGTGGDNDKIDENALFKFDPRFLLFEFLWSLLLREKQVLTVRNFIASLKSGDSKVKQMIMGAGKTTVVAPLLALMLADGDSLVLSVVPKALLEMSRKQMRETFSTIMSKRIYTLTFDRGTNVTPATNRSLTNAKKNRGVVVATPTTIKSVQLVFVETMQRLDEARRSGPKDRAAALAGQLRELKAVLTTFRSSVLLLDEVDMVLHPLKSELNFPIGEKFDLDGAEQGERWSLPMHLVDAVFFQTSGRVTTFEQSGLALEILSRLDASITEGYASNSLQKLPHVTLLNPSFYHSTLKPILAEWAYLWLQKNHLHGIDRGEAIEYILEGAVARSDLLLKVNLIDAAVTSCEVDLGERSKEPPLTKGHVLALKKEASASASSSSSGQGDDGGDNDDLDLLPPPPPSLRPNLIREKTHDTAKDEDLNSEATLRREKKCLEVARGAAETQRKLIAEIFEVEAGLERHIKNAQARALELAKEAVQLCKEIEKLEAPRDDSLDNSTVVWVSLAFAGGGVAGGGGEGEYDDGEEEEDARGGKGAGKSGASSVHGVLTVLEDTGLTVKRCGDPYEAVERVRELMVSKQLRAVVYGGGESSAGCGPSCSTNHRHDGLCLLCGHTFGRPHHKGHECQQGPRKGQRGSWKKDGGGRSGSAAKRHLSMSADEFFKRLTDEEDAFAKQHGSALPSNRCALYGGNLAVKQELRKELWGLGVCVRDSPGDLNHWVDGIGEWEGGEDDEEEEEEKEKVKEGGESGSGEKDKAGGADGVGLSCAPPPPPVVRLARAVSEGTERLDESRSRLLAVEGEQQALESSDEEARKRLQAHGVALYKRLVGSVEVRKAALDATLADMQRALSESATSAKDEDEGARSARGSGGQFSVGARSGRDAALAEAWFQGLKITKAASAAVGVGPSMEATTTTVRRLVRAVKWVEAEKESLRQVLLAAKVVALLSSPEQIKYLNLCHDWLRTFLPHCLQKVNRVSFGLLSSSECGEMLKEDPFVPRSRLALAVPFLGKDVPSKSSEFAHPDITIGLTVMAYRYSGLRTDDFNDLVDAVTSEFAHEIGPARERNSSLRFESWIAAAGGKVRGVDLSKLTSGAVAAAAAAAAAAATSSSSSSSASASTAATSWPTKGSQTTVAEKVWTGEEEDMEVVQLKFFQKSNAEQMEKLRKLWNLEPLVLHYYLVKFIFPEHMRCQRLKLSASGQSVGGDMLVGRRVGFSGTPSDLLPVELGKCEYETGDDGKMLATVLDPLVVSHEMLGKGWTVELLLDRLANGLNDDGGTHVGGRVRFNALIDTGALITGYSNEQVAAELLKRGLPWCDGVVFLDSSDTQQVLVRATGRVVSADQCGVPLERRFAFYDQIHTTGMDIKHVVNAVAVVTLGKDMVFRDYVQGAYRMRGIGQGQKVHVFVIPEVRELMARERNAANKNKSDDGDEGEVEVEEEEEGVSVALSVAAGASVAGMTDGKDMLKHIVAWLVINSMRSEQTQWSMLCIQNIGNIYRKTAFEVMLEATEKVCLDGSTAAFEAPVNASSCDPRFQLSPRESLGVFEEVIDFSLEAAVPDPLPFDAKLRGMLDQHEPFIVGTAQHAVGALVLQEVGQFSLHDGAANKLETEQEREQEQEQQKEVKARRDQQVEIEKFVDREYSRNEERPTPWPLKALLKPPPFPQGGAATAADTDHPFYALKRFALRHQESLEMPAHLFCSRNYFNPSWSGLRRIKNVVMVMEWSPSAGGGEEGGEDTLRLFTAEEHRAMALPSSPAREASFRKAFNMLSGGKVRLTRAELALTVRSMTDALPSETELDLLLQTQQQSSSSSSSSSATLDDPSNLNDLNDDDDDGVLSFEGLGKLLRQGKIHPQHKGRYYVALSLAEAETLRRVLHVRGASERVVIPTKLAAPQASAEIALRYSLVATPGTARSGTGDGGVVFDASAGWRRGVGEVEAEIEGAVGGCQGGGGVVTGATASESAVAHNAFRFFDGDMHYSDAGLNTLVRGLQGSDTLQRERFFSSTVGVRRRMERKWQETPLAKCFTLSDEFSTLKQRAACCFVRGALKKRGLKKWEAFLAFDSDDNGLLGASEVYGALRFLGMPGLTPEDVVDFLESGDVNRDGLLDYKEFLDLVEDPDSKDEDEEEGEEEGEEGAPAAVSSSIEGGADGGRGSSAASTGTAVQKKKQKRVVTKVEPFGVEEVREVIVRRKRDELAAAREDRVRREAYAADLDRKIFEEELKASALRLGGANPVKLTSLKAGGGDGAEEASPAASASPASSATTKKSKTSKSNAVGTVAVAASDGEAAATTTEYRFTRNSAPLRTVVTGKGAVYKVVTEEVLRRQVLKQRMCCQRGHELQSFGYLDRYSQCRLCKKRGVKYYCPQMYGWGSNGTSCQDFRVCEKCYKNEGEDRLRRAADPRRNETCLACDPGSSLSLMVPADAVTSEPFRSLLNTQAKGKGGRAEEEAGGVGGGSLTSSLTAERLEEVAPRLAQLCAGGSVSGVRFGLSFTVSLEVLLPSLPPPGQRLALLRFSAPLQGQGGRAHAKQRQQASVYVSSSGEVGGALMLADEKRRQKAHAKSVASVAGLRCALRLGKALNNTNALNAEEAGKKKREAEVVAAKKAEENARKEAEEEKENAKTIKAEEDAKKVEEAKEEAETANTEKKEQEENEEAEKVIKEGEKVEALFKGRAGRWFPATITEVLNENDDDDDDDDSGEEEGSRRVSYSVSFDDGDKATGLSPTQVRTLEAAKTARRKEAAAAEASAAANTAAADAAAEKGGHMLCVVLSESNSESKPSKAKVKLRWVGIFDQSAQRREVNGAPLLTKKVAPWKKLYMYRTPSCGSGASASIAEVAEVCYWVVTDIEDDVGKGRGFLRCSDSGGLPASPVSRPKAQQPSAPASVCAAWRKDHSTGVESAVFVEDASPPPASELALNTPGGAQVAVAEAWRRLSGWRNERAGCLVSANRWHSLTFVVDGSSANPLPATQVFVDGFKTPTSLVPRAAAFARTAASRPDELGDAAEEALSLLALGRRVILFGGGKQAEARGGCVRRMRITDGMLTPADVSVVHRSSFPGLNPLFAGASTKVQSLVRRKQAKTRVQVRREHAKRGTDEDTGVATSINGEEEEKED